MARHSRPHHGHHHGHHHDPHSARENPFEWPWKKAQRLMAERAQREEAAREAERAKKAAEVAAFMSMPKFQLYVDGVPLCRAPLYALSKESGGRFENHRDDVYCQYLGPRAEDRAFAAMHFGQSVLPGHKFEVVPGGCPGPIEYDRPPELDEDDYPEYDSPPELDEDYPYEYTSEPKLNKVRCKCGNESWVMDGSPYPMSCPKCGYLVYDP